VEKFCFFLEIADTNEYVVRFEVNRESLMGNGFLFLGDQK